MNDSDIARIRKAAERFQRHQQAQRVGGPPSSKDMERVRTRLKLKGFTTQEAEGVAAMAQSPSRASQVALERIIGANDLTPIAFFHKGFAASRAVGRIVITDSARRPVGFGTGFRISPRLIMTNNHVLEDTASAQQSFIQFDYVVGLDDQDVAPIEARFDPGAFFKTDQNLDFTIVALAQDAAQQDDVRNRAWLALIRESGKALEKEALNIIQHPSGNRQMIAFRNNKVIGPFEDFFHYSTDTEAGSSGSPVLNDGWMLAALHHAGVPDTDPQTGDVLKIDKTPFRRGDDPALINWIANEGTRISRIVAHLDSVGLDQAEAALYEQCFLPPDWRGRFERASPETITGEQGRRSHAARETTVGADGRVTWHFALSFGPTPSGGGAGTATQDLRGQPVAPAPVVRPTPPHRPSTPTPVGQPKLAQMAKRLVENARRERQYFDAAKDERDRRAYYEGIDLRRPSFQKLSQKLKTTHRSLNNYTTARLQHLYPWVDLYEDGTLRSIYSGKRMPPEEVIADELTSIAAIDARLAELLASAQFKEAAIREAAVLEKLEAATTPFNCEHVVPQSWFSKREPHRSDLHHLFTCESDCNSFRGNIPYHDFEDFDPQPSTDEALRRLCGKRESLSGGQRGFEPENGKGAVARATLYFLLRYPGDIGDEDRELPRQRLATLLSWHAASPPSRWEQHRNQAIFEAQGNRNPLIDFPDIATRTDFSPGFGG